jgi:hypothetical protein
MLVAEYVIMLDMITKEQFIESLVGELEIIKHLAEKINPKDLEYRPTEKQRSMLELLKYIAQVVSTGVQAQIAGSQDLYVELSKSQADVTFENFIEKIDGQVTLVREKIGALSEEDMAHVATIWGFTAPLSMRLLGSLKNAVAYKMQLFLYIKACGNDSLNTSNLWAGKDMVMS